MENRRQPVRHHNRGSTERETASRALCPLNRPPGLLPPGPYSSSVADDMQQTSILRLSARQRNCASLCAWRFSGHTNDICLGPGRLKNQPAQGVYALLFLFALASLTACDSRPSTWTAFVYPEDRTLYGEIIRTGLSSEAECREVAQQTIADLERLGIRESAQNSASYECGYRCAFRSDWRIHVCSETVD